jgi:hypothetical protein
VNAAPPADRLLSRPPDRSYLQRNGGCSHCPAPCTFLDRTRRLRAEAPADASLESYFRTLLFGDADGARREWTAWLAAWPAGTAGETAGSGTAYCAVTQSAYRWLGRVVAARGTADGPVGADQLTAAQRLTCDRAARLVARLVSAWLAAGGQPGPSGGSGSSGPDVLAATLSGLRSLIAEHPPHEMPGCASCPARCTMLSLVRPYLAGGRAEQRVSANTPPDNRLRRLRELVAQAGGIPADLDEARQRHFMHCLVTTAAAHSGADTAGLLKALDDADASADTRPSAVPEDR